MPRTSFDLRRGSPRVFLGGAALTLLAALAAGCTSTIATQNVNPVAYDYQVRHPIVISKEPEVLDMHLGMNGPALSPEIEVAIRDYVNEYRSDGTGSIAIQVPTGSANEVAAAETGRAVHYALVRAGVPRNRIQIAPYEVGDHAKLATLRLSYLRAKAVVPRCGLWPDGSTADFNSTQYQNFGCAQEQNLAAMVDNPADFVRPRAMTPADGARRSEVIKTYESSGNTGWKPQPHNDLISSGIGG